MVSALMLTYSGPVVIRARSRLQSFAFWDIATFLINGSLWVFVGVQIPGAMRGSPASTADCATPYSLLLPSPVSSSRPGFSGARPPPCCCVCIDRREAQRDRRVSWRQRFVTAWAGFRGAVSLAAALAVPAKTLSGAPFPDRSLLIFIVVVVILVTVLVQGSTLPAVVRWANMPEDAAYAEEAATGPQRRRTQAALDALPMVAEELGRQPEDVGPHAKGIRRTRRDDDGRRRRFDGTTWPNATSWSGGYVLGCSTTSAAPSPSLRNQKIIDDIVLRELQAEMDLEEVQLLDPADSG